MPIIETRAARLITKEREWRQAFAQLRPVASSAVWGACYTAYVGAFPLKQRQVEGNPFYRIETNLEKKERGWITPPSEDDPVEFVLPPTSPFAKVATDLSGKNLGVLYLNFWAPQALSCPLQEIAQAPLDAPIDHRVFVSYDALLKGLAARVFNPLLAYCPPLRVRIFEVPVKLLRYTVSLKV